MFTKTRIVQWSSICLSLLLFAAPIQGVQGQEMTESDGTGEVSGEAEVKIESEAGSEETESDIVVQPETDAANLSYRTFLPVIQGSSDSAANVSEENSQGNNEEDSQGTGEVSAAFWHPWVSDGCVNVLPAEAHLWDDMPGAGIGNEAGLLWFVTNSPLNETCSYHSDIGGVLTAQLRFRVALSDGTLFVVRLYGPGVGGCTTLLTSYVTPAGNDNGGFYSYVSPPLARIVCRVRISLTDDPDIVGSEWASALIDYIQLRNAAGAIVWEEQFPGPGPF